ncbi:MAG: DUF4239 domain-containing protein [Ilumatobacteraceae bacterium]|nr:DUF4239 domain-containing protein [Ilumatobacteraceae bacterium]
MTPEHHRPAARWLEARYARLCSWSAPGLFGGFLAWFGLWTLGAVIFVDLVISRRDRTGMSDSAAALMPAVGVLFSFLTGFVIANQWTRSRTAENTVSAESNAGLRLALSSESLGAQGARLRGQLAAYVETVIDDEWPSMSDPATSVHHGHKATDSELRRLETLTRTAANDADTTPTTAADLLASVAAVATTRRDRLNLAGHGLPAPVFGLAFLSGVVLCLNASAFASGVDPWASIPIFGMVVLIALDLALILAISAPFTGYIRVRPDALRHLADELRAGEYGALTEHHR